MVKVGDKIRIIEKPPEKRGYGPAFVFDMDGYLGITGKITRIVCENEEGGAWFNINIDGGHFIWCEDFVIKMNQRSE